MSNKQGLFHCCFKGLLVLAIVSGLVLRAEAQVPAGDGGRKAAAQSEYEARRGLPGFEWIEPLYPDCPKARFQLRNDECGGVKKHPRDPEDVLGDYWRRSVWAYTPQFAERFKPADKSAMRNDLPRHVQAIELRVVWDQEHYRYQCEVNLFIENVLMDFVKLPAGRRGARFSGAGMLPPGAKRPLPHTPAWGGFDDDDFGVYNETSFSLTAYNNADKKPGLFNSGRLLRYHRNAVDGMGYLGFMNTCNDNLLSYAQHELWLPASRTVGAPVEITRYGKENYLVLPLPSELIKRAAPYWRRAFGINVCIGEGQRTFPPGGLESQFRACEALRHSPLDSLKTPLEFFNEQAKQDQKRKPR